MYVKGIKGKDGYTCPAKSGGGCASGCRNCHNSTEKIQNKYYFLFDLISGRSSLRPTFAEMPKDLDGQPEVIDFIFKYIGYEYEIETDGFYEKIKQAIDGGKPVLARVKNDGEGAFRVLTGYKNGKLITANPQGAQGKPKVPKSKEIAELILIGSEIKPQYNFLDALKRIEKIMTENAKTDVWGDCIKQFFYFGDWQIKDVNAKEMKRRFKRINDIAYYNFNSHNFMEAFSHRMPDELKDARFDEIIKSIAVSYDKAHTLNWQLAALYQLRCWKNRAYTEIEWGYNTCVIKTLKQLSECDNEVLAAVKQAIRILE